MELKPYKTTENAVLYRVSARSKITPELVGSLAWPAEKRLLCVDHRPARLAAAGAAALKLSRRYSVCYVCYSPAAGIKLRGRAPAKAGIEVREPRSAAERNKFFALDERVYLRRWARKMTDEMKKNYRLGAGLVRSSKSLVAIRAGKPAGFFAHLPHKGVSGETFDTVVSWNLFPGLTAAQRRSAYWQALEWLKRTAKRRVSAKFGDFEGEQMASLAPGGFASERVVVERMKRP